MKDEERNKGGREREIEKERQGKEQMDSRVHIQIEIRKISQEISWKNNEGIRY